MDIKVSAVLIRIRRRLVTRAAALPVVVLLACWLRLPVQAAGEPAHGGKTEGWAAVERVLPARPRVLFVGAHPDDENAVAGLLSWLAARGELAMVTLTAGHNLDTRARLRQARGRAHPAYREPWGDPPAKRGSALATRRAAVFRRVADLLGARRAVVGPFVNGPLPLAELDGQPADAPYRDWGREPPRAVLAKWGRDLGADADAVPRFLARLIRAFRPDAVISFDGWCGGTGHPEHLAAAHALAAAMRLAADPAVRLETAEGAALPAWRTDVWITSAFIARPLVVCGHCKCRGAPPREPVLLLDLEAAPARPGTPPALPPREAKCLALLHYATASRLGGVGDRRAAALRRLCAGPARARTPAHEEIRLVTPPAP